MLFRARAGSFPPTPKILTGTCTSHIPTALGMEDASLKFPVFYIHAKWLPIAIIACAPHRPPGLCTITHSQLTTRSQNCIILFILYPFCGIPPQKPSRIHHTLLRCGGPLPGCRVLLPIALRKRCSISGHCSQSSISTNSESLLSYLILVFPFLTIDIDAYTPHPPLHLFKLSTHAFTSASHTPYISATVFTALLSLCTYCTFMFALITDLGGMCYPGVQLDTPTLFIFLIRIYLLP